MTVGSPFASNSKGKAPLSHQSWVIYVVQVSGAGVALAGVLYATQRNLTHSLRKERFDAYSRFTATANRGFRLIGQFQLKGGAQEGLQEGFRDYSDRMSDALAAMWIILAMLLTRFWTCHDSTFATNGCLRSSPYFIG
jgi:hypothetical protein